jgi:hypothetical protein
MLSGQCLRETARIALSESAGAVYAGCRLFALNWATHWRRGLAFLRSLEQAHPQPLLHL